MSYNDKLAGRVRRVLAKRRQITEKKMFGGLAFMLNDHMCCGVEGENLVIRVGPEAYQDALSQPHARPMDFTGRPMQGFVYVGPPGYGSSVDLKAWIQRGVHFVQSLPPKEKSSRGVSNRRTFARL